MITRKDYIKDKLIAEAQQYVCKICYDIPLQPVVCQGTCKQLYCRKCSSNWKFNKDCCPWKCSNPWKFILSQRKKCEYNCPYDSNCIIESSQDFMNHLQMCNKLPVHLKQKYERKRAYKCKNNHLLQFFIGNYEQMTTSICAECGQKQLCRSRCQKCKLKYCVKCRIPPCTKKSCPIGHTYNLMPQPGPFYICDICGMVSSFINKAIYDDKNCNFGICEICYDNLPQNISQNVSQTLKSQNSDILCEKNHILIKIQTFQRHKCYNCEQMKFCFKKCVQCDIYYCMSCKFFQINDKFCEQNHQYVFQQTNSCCQICNQQKTQFYIQPVCGYIICTKCHQYILSIQIDKNRFKQDLVCKNNHKLKYYIQDNPSKRYCSVCNKRSICQLICGTCNPQTNYCFNCRRIDLKQSCYLGHPYKQIDNYNGNCYICEEKNKEISKCWSCRFFICKKCKQGKQKITQFQVKKN